MSFISPVPFQTAIKSIQYGSVVIGSGGVSVNTAAVTAVVVAKSQLTMLGQNTDGTTFTALATLTLTNSTTVTATRQTTSPIVTTVTFVLVEYI